MKKFWYLVLTIPFFLTSCGSDSVEDQLQGIWNLDSQTLTACPDADDNGSINFGDDGCIDIFGETICFYATMDFQSGGALVLTSTTVSGGVEEVDTDTGTYTVNEDNDSVEICIDGECNSGTVTFDGNSMTWVGTVDGCTATLVASK